MEAHTSLGSSFDATPFERTLVYSGDVLGTARSLRETLKRPVAVVAGSETGAELADALAEVLSLRGNGSALSRCRQDKFSMVERLRECGLTDLIQRRCSSAVEAQCFAAELGRPVVVKPCTGSGTDCVAKCNIPEAAANAAAGILGGRNEAVLVQEHVLGVEYIVDCVSLDGQHIVTGIWASQRAFVGSDFAYDRTSTCPYSNEEGCICEYVFQCLAALGVQNGASHTKVIYSATRGPVLVKTCPWIQRSIASAVWAACTAREHAQPYLVADALTDAGMMFSWKSETAGMGNPSYELANYAVILDLQCHDDGILARSVDEVAGPWLRALSSFWTLKCDLEPGDRIYRSRDASTSPGYIVLIGPDPAVVESEAAIIREAERNGQLYSLSTSTSSKTPTPPACSDDEGTWGKCGLFLPMSSSRDPAPGQSTREMRHMLNLKLEPSPTASPELLPKACAEFVLDDAWE